MADIDQKRDIHSSQKRASAVIRYTNWVFESSCMIKKIVTIGVYGFDESCFFGELRKAKVDTFCDIRNRRGMRGATYAFVNSLYLQDQLSKSGIRYLHRRDLAPTKAIRDKQTEIDKVTHTLKRERKSLGDSFIEAYHSECLSKFDSNNFVSDLEDDAEIVAFFCVEKNPDACHRSLVASKLEAELSLEVQHIEPTKRNT